MQYSLEKISTVQEYGTLLASAEKKKQRLERRRRNLGESISAFSKRIDEIAAKLASLEILLKAFTTAYRDLPAGKDKLRMNVEVTRLELRKALLAKKALTCNVPALLSKQAAYNRLGNQLTVLNSFIAALQTHKTALGTAQIAQPATVFLQAPVVRQKSLPEKKWYGSKRSFAALHFKHRAMHELPAPPASLSPALAPALPRAGETDNFKSSIGVAVLMHLAQANHFKRKKPPLL